MTGRIGAYAEPVNHSLATAVERARIAERLGYDSVWVSQMADCEDGPMILAAQACATNRVGLGVAGLTIYQRHPTATVQLAATLDALSGGRFRLGLVVGHELTVDWMWGLRSGPPVKAMREYLTLVRSSLRQGAVSSRGQHFTARWRYSGHRRPDLPILVGALGPKMLELAGELADGVMLWLCSPAYIRDHVIPRVRAGRERAGLPMEGFEVQASVYASLTANPSAPRERLRQLLAMYGKLPPYQRMLEASGWADDLASGVIRDSTIDQISGIGNEAAVLGVLHRYQEAGCSLPVVAPIGDHPGAADFETLLRVAIGGRRQPAGADPRPAPAVR